MDKIKSCVERIRVIRGVNYGIITNEQIENIFDIFGLDELQKKGVFEILENDKIIPIPESEIPQKVLDLKSPPKIKVEPKELDEKTECERRRERFEKVLDAYKQDLKDEPILATKYEEEIPVFINALIALKDEPCRNTCRKIVKACMAVGHYRVREAKKYGWVCGTGMSEIREYFGRWIKRILSEDELDELMECIILGNDLTQEQLEKVKILLHHTPKVHVNFSEELYDLYNRKNKVED